YLDVEDEITSAAARIRGTRERRLALVLPSGSRVSTSRINFRLLAREAELYERDLAIVAADAATRALAATAGLPVYASVAEFEDALASAEPEGDDGGAPGSVASDQESLSAPVTPRPARPAPPLVRPRSSITDTLVMPLPEVAEERRGR